MENAKRISAAVIGVTIGIVLFLLLFGIMSRPAEKPKTYLLKSTENGVVLFYGDQPVERYESIVPANLPREDRERLESGIPFGTIEQAQSAAEDYDG